MDFDQILNRVTEDRQASNHKRKLELLKESAVFDLISKKISRISNIPSNNVAIKSCNFIPDSIKSVVVLEFSILDNNYILTCSEDKIESFIHSLPSKITDFDDPDIVITLNLITYMISSDERDDLINMVYNYRYEG